MVPVEAYKACTLPKKKRRQKPLWWIKGINNKVKEMKKLCNPTMRKAIQDK